jgi:CMP-N,N'-diacetyllegionaminic acid synthase
MYKGKSFLAIIPARSGSKGVLNKNIKEVNGKPLIAYTIEAAKKSNIFDDIIVSTDSQQYATIAQQYGASTPFLRPESLSTDTASTTNVIIHTINELQKLGKKYDYFILLQPTSPLRTEDDIMNAVLELFKKDAYSIVSVCEAEHSPLLMNRLDDSFSMKNFINDSNNKRRQDLQTFYRLNGAIYLCNTEYFLTRQTFYGEKSHALIMSQNHSIDIDSEIDIEFLSFYLSKNNSQTIE